MNAMITHRTARSRSGVVFQEVTRLECSRVSRPRSDLCFNAYTIDRTSAVSRNATITNHSPADGVVVAPVSLPVGRSSPLCARTRCADALAPSTHESEHLVTARKLPARCDTMAHLLADALDL